MLMPKIVDHDEQRRLISQAAVQWIAAHGVETLSQRSVAALCGRSKGNVQHYFTSKNALMFGALRCISDTREERGRPASGAPDGEDHFSALARTLYAVLPRDQRSADEWRVHLSLYVYAHRDKEMQAYLANHAEMILATGTKQIRAAQERGEVRPELDPRLTFRCLSAAVAGIAVAALANGGALTAKEQEAMLAEALRVIAV